MRRTQASVIGLVVALGLAGCGGDSGDGTSTGPSKRGDSSSPSVPIGVIRTAALAAPTSCDDLLRQLKALGLSQVGPFGFSGSNGYGIPVGTVEKFATAESQTSGAMRDMASSTSAPSPVSSEETYSQTNNQVVGVDEPDTVKTDGATLWTVRGLTVFAVALGDTPSVVAQRTFASSPSLLRVGNSLLALAPQYNETSRALVGAEAETSLSYPYQHASSTKIEVLDSASLATKDSLVVAGDIQAARSVGDSIRLVVSEPGPEIGFVVPTELNRLDALEIADAKNRKAVADSTLKDWIPESWLSGDREQSCRSFGVPAAFSGFSLLGVAGIGLENDKLSLKSMAGLIADPGAVYANETSLYVATTRYVSTNISQDVMPRVLESQSTELHRFNIANVEATKYEASGSVKGRLLNQYSMDEFNDVLRIATTTEQWASNDAELNATESRVTTLQRDGKELIVRGQVTGLGKRETIQSVRFVEDRGYVVTFRQTDPLYVIDLADAAAPKVTGELKVTGFSEYLHPVGEHRLLGVGPETDQSGMTTGYQASLFDVSDPAAPKMLSRIELGQGGSNASLQYDPHAFLYWAKTGLAVIPVSNYYETGVGTIAPCETGAMCRMPATAGVLLQSIGITVGDTLTTLGNVISPAASSNSYYWYDNGPTRNVVANGSLYTISSYGIVKSNLVDLEAQTTLALQSDGQPTDQVGSSGANTSSETTVVAPEK